MSGLAGCGCIAGPRVMEYVVTHGSVAFRGRLIITFFFGFVTSKWRRRRIRNINLSIIYTEASGSEGWRDDGRYPSIVRVNIDLSLGIYYVVLFIWVKSCRTEKSAWNVGNYPSLKVSPCPNHSSYRLGSFTQLDIYIAPTCTRIFTFLGQFLRA